MRLIWQPTNNKWQTFDIYLHKTNDLTRPYENLTNNSSLPWSLFLSPVTLRWDISLGKRLRNIMVRCVTSYRAFIFSTNIFDLYLNLKMSILPSNGYIRWTRNLLYHFNILRAWYNERKSHHKLGNIRWCCLLIGIHKITNTYH